MIYQFILNKSKFFLINQLQLTFIVQQNNQISLAIIRSLEAYRDLNLAKNIFKLNMKFLLIGRNLITILIY